MIAGRRLLLLSGTRLPTPMARGGQIVHMADALAAVGGDVELWHVRNPAGGDLFAHYGIARRFRARAWRWPDVTRLERALPAAAFRALFVLQELGRGWWLTVHARRAAADLYHTRDLATAFWLSRHRLPTVLELHRLPRRQRPLVRTIVAGPEPRRIVVLTPQARDRLRALGTAPARLRVLPNGIDPGAFGGAPPAAECRVRLGLPAGRPLVGYVGHFTTHGEEKGLPDVIRAMARVAPVGGADPLLVCVGGPMHRIPAYEAVARRAGVPATRLLFRDVVPPTEVPLWLGALDAGVLPYPDTPHYAHGMSPLKLLEHLAAGVPVVATDLPTLRTVLIHDRNALLVPPGDPAALAAALDRLLADRPLALRLAEAGRATVAGRTWADRARALTADLW